VKTAIDAMTPAEREVFVRLVAATALDAAMRDRQEDSDPREADGVLRHPERVDGAVPPEGVNP
jgi:hypothetical protein